MTLRDQSTTGSKPKRKPKSERERIREAYQRGVHDGQMGAFTMMAFVAHPDLLTELLEGRTTALVRALKAVGGHPEDRQEETGACGYARE